MRSWLEIWYDFPLWTRGWLRYYTSRGQTNEMTLVRELFFAAGPDQAPPSPYTKKLPPVPCSVGMQCKGSAEQPRGPDACNAKTPRNHSEPSFLYGVEYRLRCTRNFDQPTDCLWGCQCATFCGQRGEFGVGKAGKSGEAGTGNHGKTISNGWEPIMVDLSWELRTIKKPIISQLNLADLMGFGDVSTLFFVGGPRFFGAICCIFGVWRPKDAEVCMLSMSWLGRQKERPSLMILGQLKVRCQKNRDWFFEFYRVLYGFIVCYSYTTQGLSPRYLVFLLLSHQKDPY